MADGDKVEIAADEPAKPEAVEIKVVSRVLIEIREDGKINVSADPPATANNLYLLGLFVRLIRELGG